MGLLSNIETMNATVATQALIAIETLYGVDAILVRPALSIEEDVYGVTGSDNDNTILGTRTVILTEIDFSDIGPQVFGLTEGQFIYTRAADIQAGDKLEIVRTDDKPLNLRVIKSKGLGITEIVLYQLEVSNIELD